MRVAMVTTTEFDEKGRLAVGEQIIKEIVPIVMRGQTSVDTVGSLVESRVKGARPKKIKVRMGYEDGRFYNVNKDGSINGSYVYDIRVWE